MRLNSMICVVMALLLSASVCFAQGDIQLRPYVRVSGGGTFLSDSTFSEPGFRAEAEFDPGYVIGAAMGLSMEVESSGSSIPLRIEAEFNYQKNDMDEVSAYGTSMSVGGDVSIASLMLNGYIDFKNNSVVTPYLMAGIGAAKVDATIKAFGSSGSGDDLVAAFQLGAGLGFAVSENVSVDAEYRYFMTSDPNLDGVDAEIGSGRLQVGVRYAFD